MLTVDAIDTVSSPSLSSFKNSDSWLMEAKVDSAGSSSGLLELEEKGVTSFRDSEDPLTLFVLLKNGEDTLDLEVVEVVDTTEVDIRLNPRLLRLEVEAVRDLVADPRLLFEAPDALRSNLGLGCLSVLVSSSLALKKSMERSSSMFWRVGFTLSWAKAPKIILSTSS